MPGFTTHFVFGDYFFDQWTDEAFKEVVNRHRHIFHYGLQGPDFFFFYLPGFLLPHAPNPGGAAHTGQTQELFRQFFVARTLLKSNEERAIADAYLLGLIGHYLLDRSCHPYVYARTGMERTRSNYLAHHMFLESDIDVILLQERCGLAPSDFDGAQTIAVSDHERHVMAKLITYAYNHTYAYRFSEANIRFVLRCMPFCIRMLHDKSGRKKVAVRRMEQLLLRKPAISPLILSDTLRFYIDPMNLSHHTWKNPWKQTLRSNASFPELVQKALTDYLTCAAQFASLRSNAIHIEAFEPLLASLGDDSYHSGLPYGTFEE